MRRLLLILAVLTAVAVAPAAEPPLPSAKEMAASLRDVWGEAAERQPGGPSYEFFRDLLPPLGTVNTDFRHYPLALSAPGGAVKARWVSNGSAVNARANQKPMWRELGTPVSFRVGGAEAFGTDLARLDGPRYADGWLPIAQVAYTHDGMRYEQEAFAPVRGVLAEHGTVMLRFTARQTAGTLTAVIAHDGPLNSAERTIRDDQGRALVLHDANWQWDGTAKTLTARLAPGQPAHLAVPTQPLPQPVPVLTAAVYDDERRACIAAWQAILQRGTQFTIPELVVQNAWRALVVGNYLIAVGDRMNYSAGNAYDHLYEGECGDAVRALMLFGQTADARRMVGPLLDFNRQATRYHVAGHKLQLLTHYYWVTRDAAYLREKEPVWRPVADFIVTSRQTPDGLLPRDNYAGDIPRQVVSLSSNSNCWRGLRDLAAVLVDIGESKRAATYAKEAEAFRTALLAAVAKSERRDTDPPFLPIALYGDEEPHSPLTATRTGSYYDLMAPYVIGSGLFPPGSERETWLIEYLRRHGGIALGMIRSMPHQGQFNGEPGVNVLYGLRYMLAQLRRDERAKALTGFYGQLAQAMTRETFVGGEGSRFFHGGPAGRSFYLPPNSASNAMFLQTLRYLLVQDWDLDDDGRPETLRLLYGAPGRWLADGAVLAVERAPTVFGPLSLRVEARLAAGEITVTLDAPPRRPARTLLRPPLPPGWRLGDATLDGAALLHDPDGSVDLPHRAGRMVVRFTVHRDGK